METAQHVAGNIPQIVKNVDQKVYEENLEHYLRVVFNKAQNLKNPYHNFRHMCHVLYLCYKACIYYEEKLSMRERRNLLIAALFHDFDHNGKTGPDIVNIGKAIAGLVTNLLPEDRESLVDIINIIQATEYPYKTPSEELSLSCQIIRDADQSQVLSIAWIQQVVFGLSEEWGKTPLEVLKIQKPFLEKLVFATDWAKEEFPQEMIEEKINEAEALLKILKEEN